MGQPEEGKFSCRLCGVGLTTRTDNAVSADECREECSDGKQLAFDGNCEPCPVGTYRKKAYIWLAKNAETVLPQAEPEPLKKANVMSLFVHREHIWILRLTIVFCVLADITNNLTTEPVVTNARQIPLLQLKDLDLQMIVPISVTMPRTDNLPFVKEMPIAFSIKTI